MKNSMDLARVSALLLAAALALPPARAAGPKIGLLLKDHQSSFWGYVEKGAAEAARKNGATLIVKAPPTVYNVGTQFQLLESLRQQGIDALLIAPLSPEAISAPVANLAASGVKVVSLDSALRSDVPHHVVKVNQTAMGEMIANLALSLSAEGDEITLFRNNTIDQSVIDREKVMIEKLGRGHANRVLHADVYGAPDLGSEEHQARLALEKYPRAKLIVVTASSPTLTMLRAIRAAKLNPKITLIGFGVYLDPEIVAALQDGTMGGFVAQEPKQMGAAAVETALALLAGKSVPPVVETEFQIVTKGTLDSPEAKALLNP